MTNTANKLTVADVKKFHARADVRAAIASIKEARKHSERITAHVDSYLDPAFTAFAPFYTEPTKRRKGGERITARKDLFMCGDVGSEQCNEWFALCDELHRANGYTDLEPGQCPALIAQHDARKCEWALLSMVEELTGANFNANLKLRAKVLELFLNPPMV